MKEREWTFTSLFSYLSCPFQKDTFFQLLILPPHSVFQHGRQITAPGEAVASTGESTHVPFHTSAHTVQIHL